MNAEFNWWLLIVGLVVGAGLVWFVLLDARRREIDIDDEERRREAAWLSRSMAEEGYDLSPQIVERVLEFHRAYLAAPPPDAPPADEVPASELSEDDRIGVERGASDLGQ